ncbi:hypothetical protein GWK47_039798 [Chionoecetes opilio]|uniref:Uncharacterized protein n=1 Tax=Chionoecetes opilio TaxID=41210 RepID=A0A8J5D166_CHIOP|nr:hypothetical protein GWK47_039798 [Chionoecetes opilio]
MSLPKGPGFKDQKPHIGPSYSNVNPETTISIWTGFNIKTRRDLQGQDTVSYLPLQCSRTECPPLKKSWSKPCPHAVPFKLNKIVCGFFQHSMPKLRGFWKQEKFKNLSSGWGVFHTNCNLLTTKRKRFFRSGLRDRVWNRGHRRRISVRGDGRPGVKKAVRLHKLVYEDCEACMEGFLPG